MSELKYLTADQAATILHVKPIRVVDLCKRKKLVAFKPGKAWLIKESDLEAYIEAHRNQPVEDAA